VHNPRVGVLIRAYGELWSPDLVNWGSRGPGGKGELLGEFGGRRRPTVVDVWEQRGVYVLLQDWKVFYVGKADSVPLGVRLRGHLADSLAGRWDRFSWYGIRGVRKDGALGADMMGKNTSAHRLIDTLESLLIAVTEPPRNRRREEIPGAVELVQQGRERRRPFASSLEEIRVNVGDVVTRLKRLEKHLP
jgi:hypothetical protein